MMEQEARAEQALMAATEDDDGWEGERGESDSEKRENRKERNRRNARETRRRKKEYMACLCEELGALRAANEVQTSLL
jgi:hypothetical protein